MMDPIVRRVIADRLLREGRHIHSYYPHKNDEMCQGGDPECPLWEMQLDEAMEEWCGS